MLEGGACERLKRLAARKRTPLTVSCILAAPLYFLSLLLASLALDRPRIVAWTHRGTHVEHFHPTAGGLEARSGSRRSSPRAS